MPNKRKVKKAPYLEYTLAHQRAILYSLLFLVLVAPLVYNFAVDKTPIIGAESYYHLAFAKSILQEPLGYNPVTLLVKFVPTFILPFIALALGMLSLFLFDLTKGAFGVSKKQFFLFSFVVVLTPAFISHFTQITSYSLVVVLSLFAMWIIHRTSSKGQLLSIIPLALISFVDLMSSVLVLLLLLTYFSQKFSKKERRLQISILVVFIGFILTNMILSTPLIIGPFSSSLLGIVSDLGSLQGVGLFVVLLGLIGFLTQWRKRKGWWMYLGFVITLTAYIINHESLFYLSLVIAFFAALGLERIIDHHWELKSLQQFTILLLILGIAFSSVTHIERNINNAPTNDELLVLSWMDYNLEPGSIVLSDIKNSYLIRAKTSLYPTRYPHQNDEEFDNIFAASYVSEVTPFLESNNVSYIYITRDMRESLPEDSGLLFLLSNERFKIIHTGEDTEVWEIKQ